MSFGDRAFGAALDWGDALPRRARRAVALSMLLLVVFAPSTFQDLVTRYAERQAAELVNRLTPVLSPTSPEAPASP